MAEAYRLGIIQLMQILIFGLCLSLWFLFPPKIASVYDPLSVSNNRFGIHILDPIEVEQAAKLVNSNGGKWGYVTVPIRADDRDREKWWKFFNKCRELEVIPILRLATYARGDTWILPTEAEMLDFANFLHEMPWPVKNRYLIVFNEINHSNEWGGFVDPDAYAEILNYTIDIFKQRSSDYFILPAGMDMAAPTNYQSIDGITYYLKVFKTKPELLDKIDGWNAHAYPNPGFKGKPSDKHSKSIVSYRYELDLLKRLGRKEIPVFITETGWDQEVYSEQIIGDYWNYSWNYIWNDKQIVAITPFLLKATDGPFTKFSFMKADDDPGAPYQAMEKISKKAGNPPLSEIVEIKPMAKAENNPANITWNTGSILDLEQMINNFKVLVNDIRTMNLRDRFVQIGASRIDIEVADSPEEVSLGLGYRHSMPQDHGMLFVFDKIENGIVPSFWMKNTLFPLDIIWISNDHVVDLTENVPVEPDPANPINFYRPKDLINYVLEVNAGFAAKHGIKVGDEVTVIR